MQARVPQPDSNLSRKASPNNPLLPLQPIPHRILPHDLTHPNLRKHITKLLHILSRLLLHRPTQRLHRIFLAVPVDRSLNEIGRWFVGQRVRVGEGADGPGFHAEGCPGFVD